MTTDDLPDPPDVSPGTGLTPKQTSRLEILRDNRTAYLRVLRGVPTAERVAKLTPTQKRKLTKWDTRIEKLFGGRNEGETAAEDR